MWPSPKLDRTATETRFGSIESDRNGLEVLGREECLQLLSGAMLGRIGVSIGALPVILPVNFRLIGDRIVFRTGTGTKLDAATRRAVVAFEVDEMEPLSHSGWSVVVTGRTREVTDPAALEELARANIPRWAHSERERVVEIETSMVSGRRIGHHRREEGETHG
jgi:nitroimidazol reductase NimA-like FMN-containing flavoprotein (pyridoxamine 5'-phosphate oxidase superfamily)